MSIYNENIYNSTDIITALQSAQNGDIFNFYIQNDIVWGSVIIISSSITINLINGSGMETVTLSILLSGTYRHFSTLINGTVTGFSMNVNKGIIFDGAATGGGLAIYGSNCSLTLTDCTFSNCRSSGNGGGVLVQGNTSKNVLTMNDVHFKNCFAGSGGGIFGSGCNIEMNGGEITRCNAASSGGGITTTAGAAMLGSTLTINSGNIIGNICSAGDGGGINAFDTIVTIMDTEISGNTADINGGGIYCLMQFMTDEQNKLIIRDSSIFDNTIRNIGGGICLQGNFSEFTIENCTIFNNRATSTASGTNQGGAIYFSGGSTLTLHDGQIMHNTAGKAGGGVLVNGSTLILTGTVAIVENESGNLGGAIYGYYGAMIIIEGNAWVTNNTAICTGDPERIYSGGGAVALYASDIIIRENALISENTALSYGGAIWAYPEYLPVSTITMEGGTLIGNDANYGGAFSMGAVEGYTPQISITGGSITQNVAIRDGGGIIAKGTVVAIEGCEIVENIAGRDGGGIFTDDLANVTVYASAAFGGNTAGNYVYWAVTNGGDSDIYNAYIFTDIFSTFVPVQTSPLLTWDFLNAYNNYDINYVQPIFPFSVRFFGGDGELSLIHSTTINSFLGATVIIPPREEIVDSEGNVWLLSPPQPAQTIELTDPQANYDVSFLFEEQVASIVVSEYYQDTSGNEIMPPTQTIVESGGNYSKTAPMITGYTFMGYKINHEPFKTGTVHIIGISADTVVLFVYEKKTAQPYCRIPRRCYRYTVRPCQIKQCSSCRCLRQNAKGIINR